MRAFTASDPLLALSWHIFLKQSLLFQWFLLQENHTFFFAKSKEAISLHVQICHYLMFLLLALVFSLICGDIPDLHPQHCTNAIISGNTDLVDG